MLGFEADKTAGTGRLSLLCMPLRSGAHAVIRLFVFALDSPKFFGTLPKYRLCSETAPNNSSSSSPNSQSVSALTLMLQKPISNNQSSTNRCLMPLSFPGSAAGAAGAAALKYISIMYVCNVRPYVYV